MDHLRMSEGFSEYLSACFNREVTPEDVVEIDQKNDMIWVDIDGRREGVDFPEGGVNAVVNNVQDNRIEFLGLYEEGMLHCFGRDGKAYVSRNGREVFSVPKQGNFLRPWTIRHPSGQSHKVRNGVDRDARRNGRRRKPSDLAEKTVQVLNAWRENYKMVQAKALELGIRRVIGVSHQQLLEQIDETEHKLEQELLDAKERRRAVKNESAETKAQEGGAPQVTKATKPSDETAEPDKVAAGAAAEEEIGDPDGSKELATLRSLVAYLDADTVLQALADEMPGVVGYNRGQRTLTFAFAGGKVYSVLVRAATVSA